jgi:hypothetical protein
MRGRIGSGGWRGQFRTTRTVELFLKEGRNAFARP